MNVASGLCVRSHARKEYGQNLNITDLLRRQSIPRSNGTVNRSTACEDHLQHWIVEGGKIRATSATPRRLLLWRRGSRALVEDILVMKFEKNRKMYRANGTSTVGVGGRSGPRVAFSCQNFEALGRKNRRSDAFAGREEAHIHQRRTHLTQR